MHGSALLNEGLTLVQNGCVRSRLPMQAGLATLSANRRVNLVIESSKRNACLTPPLDPSLYPASYRTSVWKGGLAIFGTMTLFCIYIFAHTDVFYRGATAPFAILCAILLLVILINTTFAKVVLYPDRIERVTLFGTKTMLRADVVKLERRRRLFSRSLYLTSKRGLFEGVLLPSGIETDAAWDAWMPAAQDAYVPTRSAMLRGSRTALAIVTLLVSLGCLIIALVVHTNVKRRATETPVTATVGNVWSEPGRGGPTYFARLIFDRKQSDGEIIHCDVPHVEIGPPIKAGTTIKVAPRSATCWEPDIICETCSQSSDALAMDMLIVAAISGLICTFLFWLTLREKNKPA